MLYNTHKKFGYMFGLMGVLLSFLNGWIVTIPFSVKWSDKIMVLLLTYVAIRASVFGAGFPDIDSPGSVPARQYPFLRKVFSFFKIKHRGKVSHDYVSITVIFGVVYFVVVKLLDASIESKSLLMGLAFYVCYIVSRDIVNEAAFKMVRNKKTRKRVIFFFKPIVAGALFVILTVLGFIRLGESTTAIYQTLNFVAPLLKVWVVFAWVGAISHLFADMLTNAGVHFLGKSIAPAKIVLLVKKVPLVGKHLIASDMKTGSKYEDMWNKIVTYAIIPLVILVIIAMSGGDVQELLRVITSGVSG